jgi:protein gp37
MAKNSKIEWTDHTVNLWWGCTKVHAGCDNCYAEATARRYGNDIWGEGKDRKRIKSAFNDLNKYQKEAEAAGEQVRVFVGSMMDIFEKSKPISDDPFMLAETTGDLRSELFSRISEGKYNNITFLFLTKRPSNINKQIPLDWQTNPPNNVWFGCSPVDQNTFDNLVPMLQQVNGKLFLSVEPQIGEIKNIDLTGIGWVIQGGESGQGKRPFNLQWADRLRLECQAQNVPYFFKQIDKVQEIPDGYKVRELPYF